MRQVRVRDLIETGHMRWAIEEHLNREYGSTRNIERRAKQRAELWTKIEEGSVTELLVLNSSFRVRLEQRWCDEGLDFWTY